MKKIIILSLAALFLSNCKKETVEEKTYEVQFYAESSQGTGFVRCKINSTMVDRIVLTANLGDTLRMFEGVGGKGYYYDAKIFVDKQVVAIQQTPGLDLAYIIK